MIICFIGPDGSGKTTYAKNMFKYVINKGFKASYHELNFGFLPRISAILNIFRIKKKVLKDPEGEFHSGVKYPPYNPIKAILLALYWSFDYALLRIHSALEPEKVFIFARYSYDYSFLYGYRRLPAILKSLIISISPTPTKTFYISRKPFVIYSDKPELPIQIINETQEIIKSMQVNHEFVKIDVIEGSVEETFASILYYLPIFSN